jgi:LysM repeat protein
VFVALFVSFLLPSVPAVAAPASRGDAAPAAYVCLYYTVRYGDTLSEIAARYGVTVRSIMSANHLHSTVIYAGQHLCIPTHAPPPPPPPQPCNPVPYTPYPCPPPPIPPPCGTGYTGSYPCGSWTGGPVTLPYTPYVPSAGFPCSKPYENESNLCIEQPFPVPAGSTASAVWRITDFVQGCFDKGDGRGCIGPIYREQRVPVPSITAPRTVRLMWKDHAGNTRSDSMVIQVASGATPYVGSGTVWTPGGGSDR